MKIITKEESRKQILDAITQFKDTVGSTLGPRGTTVLISSPVGIATVTKDGYTVAQRYMDSRGELYQEAVEIATTATNAANTTRGDGTTTATVLTHAFLERGLQLIQEGGVPVLVKRQLDTMITEVLAELDSRKELIDADSDMIYNIALVACNGDTVVADLVTDSFKKVGLEGVITWERADDFETKLEEESGFKFERGVTVTAMIPPNKNKVEVANPRIVLLGRELNAITQLNISKAGNVLQNSIAEQKPLLVFCTGVEEKFRATLQVMCMQNQFPHGFYVVEAPQLGVEQQEWLSDLALYTGGEVVSKVANMNQLGTCDMLELTRESTTLMGIQCSDEALDKRIEEIKLQKEETTNDFEKANLQHRIAKLSAGMIRIMYATSTSAEYNEVRDRIEDSVSAVRAALEDGIIAGGGSELYRIGMGREGFYECLSSPLELILKHANNKDQGVFVALMNKGFTYDINKELIDSYQNTGLVDPVSVTKSSLKSAASAAGTLLTVGCSMVREKLED